MPHIYTLKTGVVVNSLTKSEINEFLRCANYMCSTDKSINILTIEKGLSRKLHAMKNGEYYTNKDIYDNYKGQYIGHVNI